MKALDHHIASALNLHSNEISSLFECDVLGYVGPMYWDSVELYREVIDKLVMNRATRDANKPYINDRLVIVLETNGGSVEVVEKIVEMTRHHYSEVHFVIPNYAMSAGTIWSMSGNKIWMDYASSLGPIDPQVQSLNGGWVPALGYIEKKLEMDAKAANGTLTQVDVILLNALDLAELDRFEQARKLSINLLKDWLVNYKFKNWNVHRTTNPGTPVSMAEKLARAEQIAADLSSNTRWHSHGRFIGINRLVSDLRLEIDSFSALPGLSEHARMYLGLLNDQMDRQNNPIIVHCPT